MTLRVGFVLFRRCTQRACKLSGCNRLCRVSAAVVSNCTLSTIRQAPRKVRPRFLPSSWFCAVPSAYQMFLLLRSASLPVSTPQPHLEFSWVAFDAHFHQHSRSKVLAPAFTAHVFSSIALPGWASRKASLHGCGCFLRVQLRGTLIRLVCSVGKQCVLRYLRARYRNLSG